MKGKSKSNATSGAYLVCLFVLWWFVFISCIGYVPTVRLVTVVVRQPASCAPCLPQPAKPSHARAQPRSLECSAPRHSPSRSLLMRLVCTDHSRRAPQSVMAPPVTWSQDSSHSAAASPYAYGSFPAAQDATITTTSSSSTGTHAGERGELLPSHQQGKPVQQAAVHDGAWPSHRRHRRLRW